MKISSISFAPLAHALRAIGRAGHYTVTRHDTPSRPGPTPADFGDKVRAPSGRVQPRADAPALTKARDSLTRVSDKLLQLSSEGIGRREGPVAPKQLFRALDQLSKAATALEHKGGDASAHLRSGLAGPLGRLDSQQLTRMADTWNAVEDRQLRGHSAVFVAALRSAIVDALRLRTETEQAAALKSALVQAEPAIKALFGDTIEGRRDGQWAFGAMVGEIERRANISGVRAERAVFDVIEQWVSKNEVTPSQLIHFTRRLSPAMLNTVARAGEWGGGPARVVVDNVIKDTLGTMLSDAHLPDVIDSELGAVALALRALKGPDITGRLAGELALRKDRAAEPFRDAMSRISASRTPVEFFVNLESAQARFQDVLEKWGALGELVVGGSDIADAHYRLVRDFADRQGVASLQKMHGILESAGIVACRDAITWSAQELLLQGATGDDRQRCVDLVHLASLGLVSFSSAVADSLASRDAGFRGTPARQAPAADMPALTNYERAVLEQALRLGFTGGGETLQPVLMPKVDA